MVSHEGKVEVITMTISGMGNQATSEGYGAGLKAGWVETPADCSKPDMQANLAGAPAISKPGSENFSGPAIGHPEINERLAHALDWCYYRQWHRSHVTVGEWRESGFGVKINERVVSKSATS